MIFNQKAWIAHNENNQKLWFLKRKNGIEKFENWMAFDQNPLTITHETAKYEEKIKIFHRKLYDIAEP